MTNRERIPLWRLWYLRMRAWSGWGLDIPELRQWSTVYARMSRGVPFFAIAYAAFLIVLFEVLPHYGIVESYPLPIPRLVRSGLPLAIMLCVIALISAGWSLLYRRRAEAGVHQPVTTTYGYCYASAIAPSLALFVLLGPSRQDAQWFRLPITWDTIVEPSGDRFELTYNPATGFVANLKRIGAEPRELSQVMDETLADKSQAHGSHPKTATTGEATAEQRREVKQLARRAGITWGTSSRSALSTGIGLLLVAIFYVVMPIVIIEACGQPSDFQVVEYAVIIIEIISVATLVWGIYMMREWARLRQFEAQAPVTIEGNQLCWTRKRSKSATIDDFLALVQTDDGHRVVFRVRHRWRHRLREDVGRVRVTYYTGSGLVLDYRPVEASSSH